MAPHEGWIGKSIGAFEAATGTRAAIYTRFGTGQLPLPSTLIQSGDTLHMLAADDHRAMLHDIAGRAPDGSTS